MATQLFLRGSISLGDDYASTHLGTNNARRDGTATGWHALSLSTARGSAIRGSVNTPTVTGATNGVEAKDNTSGLPIEWISPPAAADVTIAGTITANIWGYESNMSANVAINVIVDVIRANTLTTANSNTIVNICQSARVIELAVTTSGVNNFTVTPTSTVVNRGDRIRVRVVGDDVGTMASGFTFDVYWNGATAAADGDSYVTFTENITFEGAPGVLGVDTSVASGSVVAVGAAPASAEAQAYLFVPQGTTLTEVKARMVKSGSPTDDLAVTVETDSSGPSGSVVGTVGSVAGTTLTSTNTEYTFSGLSISLTAGASYWLVFRRTGSLDSANAYRVYFISGGGTVRTLTSGSWSAGLSASLNVSLLIPGSTVYLTDTASAVATASQDLEAWTSRGGGVTTSVTNTAAGWTAPLQATTTAGGTVIDWFTRPLTAFTLTGMAVANIRALESNALANASLRCEIARVEGDGTSPTVWCSWCCAPTGTDNGELTTSEVARTINLSGDDLAITDGQRLRIRLYNDDMSSAAMAATYTVTRYYSGTSGGASGDTYITFPQTLTEYSSGPFTYEKAGYGKEAG